MLRSLILAAVLLTSTLPATSADETTLLSSIKLQTDDRDNHGSCWDGGRWRDRDYWHHNYEWRKNRRWRHDNSCHRDWGKRKVYERGYRGGWNDHDDHRGHGHGRKHHY